MSKHLRLAALGTLSLVLAVQAQGAEEKKGLMIGGSFEGGYAHSWADNSASAVNRRGSQFFIDDLNMKFNVNVSDKVKVVVDQHWAVNSDENPYVGTSWNSADQNFDNLTLSGGTLRMATQAAYVEHKCGDHMTSQFGFVRTPFGIENMWTRYNSHSYYYSSGFTRQYSNRWDADLGIKSTFNYFGNLEVAVLEGRQNDTWDGTGGGNNLSDANMPAVAARWSTDVKASGMNITPVLSGYTGRWSGGPRDLGITAGATMKMGMLGVNAEYMYGKESKDGTDAGKAQLHNVWVEPTFDLGVVNASAKIDWVNTKTASNDSVSDWNLSGAVTHDWDKLRIRAAFTTRNLKNRTEGDRQHDFRVMFGTQF
ncbi:MAG: hypothetical protein EBR01_04570 [Proteobacteria bacterium]|nr:hypothetical protein [Pseudomonadota bacterium]